MIPVYPNGSNFVCNELREEGKMRKKDDYQISSFKDSAASDKEDCEND